MKLDSEEKRILTEIISRETWTIQELLESLLGKYEFEDFIFEVNRKRGRASYEIGLFSVDDSLKIYDVLRSISKIIRLVDKLEVTDYIEVIHFKKEKGNPLLKLGKKLDKHTEFFQINDETVFDKLIYLIGAKLEVKESLRELVTNQFFSQSQIDVRNSQKLAKGILTGNILGLLIAVIALGFSFYSLKKSSHSSSQIASSLQIISSYTEKLQVLVDELQRRPKLELSKNKCSQSNGVTNIEGFSLNNLGDIEANIEAILVIFNENDFDEFEPSKCFRKTENIGVFSVYQFFCQKKICVIPKQPHSLNFKFITKKNTNPKIELRISHKSSHSSSKETFKIYSQGCKTAETNKWLEDANAILLKHGFDLDFKQLSALSKEELNKYLLNRNVNAEEIEVFYKKLNEAKLFLED